MDDSAWPSSRRYLIGSLANWLLFLATIALLAWGSGEGRLPAGLLWVIALLHAASVAAQFFAAYRLIAAQDEFVRAITAKRIVAATGVTITAAVLCGVAVQFLGAPPVPMWVVYPFFWGAFGLVTSFIADSRP
jgi:hypothetical protein